LSAIQNKFIYFYCRSAAYLIKRYKHFSKTKKSEPRFLLDYQDEQDKNLANLSNLVKIVVQIAFTLFGEQNLNRL